MNERHVRWVADQYGRLANHPFKPVREHEFAILVDIGARYGLTITEEEFDQGIADRFGDGMEYVWPRSLEDHEAAERARVAARAEKAATVRAAFAERRW